MKWKRATGYRPGALSDELAARLIQMVEMYRRAEL
jgi:hypothetical protein